MGGHQDGAARPQLIACLDFLRSGDTLAVWRIDRLGRSVADLTTIVNDLGLPRLWLTRSGRWSQAA